MTNHSTTNPVKLPKTQKYRYTYNVIMSNGSIKQTTKTINKNFVVDYRNAKFQGEISDYERLPDGIGMLLTIDYQLVISNWEEGNINGQCLSIYPSGNIFYGSVTNNQPNQFSSYKLEHNKYLHSFIKNTEQTLIFIDFQQTKRLTIIKIPTSSITQPHLDHFHHKRSNSEMILDQLDARSRMKKLNILQQVVYGNEEQKWQIIQKITGKVINRQYKEYKKYLKQHFNSINQNKDHRLEITQNNQCLEIRFKKTGIICRINEKTKISNSVQFVGYYDCYEQRCDMFRNNKGGIQPEIQQYCQGHSLNYQDQRPKACQLNLQHYYLKSVHFVNKFISVEQLNQISKTYTQIYNCVEEEMSTKNAQIQLQVGFLQGQQRDQSQQKKTAQTLPLKKLELTNIKNDIYNRINKRKNQNSETKQSIISKMIPKDKNQSFSSHLASQYKQNFQYSPKRMNYVKYTEQNSHKRSKEYLRYTENSPAQRGYAQDINKKPEQSSILSKKKYIYLSSNQLQEQSHQTHSAKSKKSRANLFSNLIATNTLYSPYNQIKSIRYKYSQPNIQHRNSQNQSLGALTTSYQKIKHELSQSKIKYKEYREKESSPIENINTPTNRSSLKASHLKSGMISSKGTPRKTGKKWR